MLKKARIYLLRNANMSLVRLTTLLIAVFSDSGGNVATQPQLVVDDREMQGL